MIVVLAGYWKTLPAKIHKKKPGPSGLGFFGDAPDLYLFSLQFDVATEAFNPDFRAAVT